MDMARIKRDPKKVALAQAILEAYNPESVEDMNDALKDLFGPLFESMLQGEIEIESPRNRDGSFEPILVPKRKKDVSAIEGKVLAMYARGMSQRDISKTIEDIYGFSVSHEMISDITDAILPELEEWKNRPLKKCYPFLFVDCMYVSLKQDYEVNQCAVYVILGYDLEGNKKY